MIFLRGVWQSCQREWDGQKRRKGGKCGNFEKRKRGKTDKNGGMINADVDLADYGGGEVSQCGGREFNGEV